MLQKNTDQELKSLQLKNKLLKWMIAILLMPEQIPVLLLIK